VLVTRATRDLVDGGLGGGFGLKRLGEFRLRDLAEPELIYQLTHADLPAGFPPIRTVAERVGNLPLPVSSFIGRARELERTAAALGQARVVTLTGPGGVGKTRLALQAAGQVAGRFGDGAWLCELAPVRDVAGVDDAVAAVFSVAARAGQSTRETLVEFLRGKELLLVLDNCEHLLEGAAALAGTLARSCERLAILATSREGLAIEGEHLVPVPPLGMPEANADLAAITGAEAVRLFAERAAAVKPDFAVSAENAAAVAAVVRHLDGIALAIELAAARAPAMTPAELARRLERSFAVLAPGRRGAVTRHQTLRATIDWSYQLLAGPEQVLLARLAVFAGGCGEGIDPDAVFELLAALVARSLAVAEQHGPQTRYRLLETIRQYGEQHLNEAGEAERWHARHAGYYADVLRQVRDHAHDPQAEVFWAVRLGAEQDNLLAAWSWAIGTGNVGTAFAILAGFASVEVASGYPLLLPAEAALELPGAAGHPGYPLALAVSAVFASNRADVPGAEELCRRAAEASARSDARDWRVEVMICTARVGIATSVARPPRPPATPNRPPVSRGLAAISPTPPSTSRSPWPLTCLPVTRPRRSRWRTRRSRWPARSAPRPWSRPACSPSARPSPTPTPNRPAPACAKAANSAPRSATRTPWVSPGRLRSRFSSVTRPPRLSSAAAPFTASSGAVIASGWASSSTSSRPRSPPPGPMPPRSSRAPPRPTRSGRRRELLS
jgi:predicted ATPase